MHIACGFFHRHIFYFYNHQATTEIYTLSLHDALPISKLSVRVTAVQDEDGRAVSSDGCGKVVGEKDRSEEHTSELQSHSDLVCRLLLEKKKQNVIKEKQ